MAASTVRVKGLKETVKAFNKMDKDLAKELRNGLKQVAEPVAATARSKMSAYQGGSMKIRPAARGASVFVRQNARKVTGLRADFGALQMRKVLIPALDEHQEDVINGVEKVIDNLASRNGF